MKKELVHGLKFSTIFIVSILLGAEALNLITSFNFADSLFFIVIFALLGGSTLLIEMPPSYNKYNEKYHIECMKLH